MKKIIFILVLFLSCYLIYKLTINNKLSYLSIGDGLSKDNTYTYYVKEYLESLGVESKSEINPKNMRSKMGKSYSGIIGGYQIDIFILHISYILKILFLLYLFHLVVS